MPTIDAGAVIESELLENKRQFSCRFAARRRSDKRICIACGKPLVFQRRKVREAAAAVLTDGLGAWGKGPVLVLLYMTTSSRPGR